MSLEDELKRIYHAQKTDAEIAAKRARDDENRKEQAELQTAEQQVNQRKRVMIGYQSLYTELEVPQRLAEVVRAWGMGDVDTAPRLITDCECKDCKNKPTLPLNLPVSRIYAVMGAQYQYWTATEELKEVEIKGDRAGSNHAIVPQWNIKRETQGLYVIAHACAEDAGIFVTNNFDAPMLGRRRSENMNVDDSKLAETVSKQIFEAASSMESPKLVAQRGRGLIDQNLGFKGWFMSRFVNP